MVKAFVNQAVKEYSSLEVKKAIVYASANVKGGWMQYKAYLDKTLKNNWAAGYLKQTTAPSKEAILAKYGLSEQITMPAAGRFPNGTVTGCARMGRNS